MAPTTLTLAFARGERVHEADDAGGSGHVALHVLHARSRLDRDAAGVETYAFADKRDRIGAALAAVPAHDDKLRLMRRALRDAKQRAHAELAHGRHVENLDDDAELFETRRPAGEFCGIKHVGRLVDEIARPYDAIGEALRGGGPSLLRRGRIGAGEIDFDLGRPLVAFLAFGFVAVEPVGAQARAEHEIGDLVGLERARARTRP